MLLSKEELEILEACVLMCLDGVQMDEDTTKDAIAILEDIRRFLGRDAQGVAYALGEEVKSEYRAADGGHGR